MTGSTEDHCHILALEKSLLNWLLRHDRAFLVSVLADNLIEFGKSGRRYTKTTTIAALLEEGGADAVPIKSPEMEDTEYFQLSEDVVLLTYALKSSQKASDAIPTLGSSIWRRSKLNWQLVFHQGTPSAMT